MPSFEPPIALTAGEATVVLLSNGASIREVLLPDRDGVAADVVLGHPTEKDYLVSATSSSLLLSLCTSACSASRGSCVWMLVRLLHLRTTWQRADLLVRAPFSVAQ